MPTSSVHGEREEDRGTKYGWIIVLTVLGTLALMEIGLQVILLFK